MSLYKKLVRLAYENPDMRSKILPLVKEARLKDGPAGRVLDKYWNTLHDLEDGLERAAREYDVATSYSGGPGHRDAKVIRDMALRIKAQLEKVSMRELGKLAYLESAFVKKYGEPSQYASDQSAQMFPRSAQDKSARAVTYDYENGEVGVTAKQFMDFSYDISVYWPLSHTNRRGKRVHIRSVSLDDRVTRVAWAHEFLSVVKGAKTGADANRRLDKLIADAKKAGVTIRYDSTKDVKGVDSSLPTPKIQMVKDIRGSDITVDLNSKPIRLYSKSHGESLRESRQVYYFEIHPRFKNKVMALAPDLEKARSIKEAEKILSGNKIPYDHRIYIDPMWQ